MTDPATVFVPIDAFDPVMIEVVVESGKAPPTGLGGRISERRIFESREGLRGVLEGWAEFDSADPSVRLRVQTDVPLKGASAYPSMRFRNTQRDIVGGLSGFTLRMDASRNFDRALDSRIIRVISEDSEGSRLAIPWAPSGLRKKIEYTSEQIDTES